MISYDEVAMFQFFLTNLFWSDKRYNARSCIKKYHSSHGRKSANFESAGIVAVFFQLAYLRFLKFSQDLHCVICSNNYARFLPLGKDFEIK